MSFVFKKNLKNTFLLQSYRVKPVLLPQILIFCALIAGCIMPPKKPAVGTFEQSQLQLLSAVKKGKDLATAERYNEAEAEFRYAISLANANSGLYNNLGFVLLGAKKFDDAQESFEKALELDPENITAKLNLAHTLYKKELYDKALKLYSQIAQLYSEKENHQAKQKIKHAVSKTDLALVYQNMSLIYDTNRQAELAEKYSKDAFETVPNAYYAEQYAKLLLSMNDAPKAKDFLWSCFKNHGLKSPALSIAYDISLYSCGEKEVALCQSQKILKLFEYTLEEYYTAKVIILLTDPNKDLKKLKRRDKVFCRTFSNRLPAFWNESFVTDVSNLIDEVCHE